MLHADALPIPTRKPPIAVRMAIIQSIAFFTFSGSICLSIFMNLNVNFYVKTDTFAFYYVKYKIFLSDCQRGSPPPRVGGWGGGGALVVSFARLGRKGHRALNRPKFFSPDFGRKEQGSVEQSTRGLPIPPALWGRGGRGGGGMPRKTTNHDESP